MDKVYLTKQGFEALREELQYLLQVERPKLVETVAWAASNGDRSENADYIYGKRRLREIDRRIHYLQKRLEVAVVVDPKVIQTDQVVFGAWVTLEASDGVEQCYQIVGEDEIDTQRRKISWKSPLGQGLLGKKVGDEVQIQTPRGVVEYRVLRIERDYPSTS